jgi:hypothetical protein
VIEGHVCAYADAQLRIRDDVAHSAEGERPDPEPPVSEVILITFFFPDAVGWNKTGPPPYILLKQT